MAVREVRTAAAADVSSENDSIRIFATDSGSVSRPLLCDSNGAVATMPASYTTDSVMMFGQTNAFAPKPLLTSSTGAIVTSSEAAITAISTNIASLNSKLPNLGPQVVGSSVSVTPSASGFTIGLLSSEKGVKNRASSLATAMCTEDAGQITFIVSNTQSTSSTASLMDSKLGLMRTSLTNLETLTTDYSDAGLAFGTAAAKFDVYSVPFSQTVSSASFVVGSNSIAPGSFPTIISGGKTRVVMSPDPGVMAGLTVKIVGTSGSSWTSTTLSLGQAGSTATATTAAAMIPSYVKVAANSVWDSVDVQVETSAGTFTTIYTIDKASSNNCTMQYAAVYGIVKAVSFQCSAACTVSLLWNPVAGSSRNTEKIFEWQAEAGKVYGESNLCSRWGPGYCWLQCDGAAGAVKITGRIQYAIRGATQVYTTF